MEEESLSFEAWRNPWLQRNDRSAMGSDNDSATMRESWLIRLWVEIRYTNQAQLETGFRTIQKL